MKKALSIVLSLMLLLAVVPVGTISTGALEDEVIEIRTIAELYNINNNMSGNYKLMNDIDMTEDTAVGGDWDFMGNGWEPIGSEGIYSNTPFTGTFDGDGHKIIGMRINRNTTPSGSGTIYLGLFANNAGTINNLGIDETSSISYGSYSGGICANNSGTISNCFNKARISSSGYYSGGICAYNSGEVSNCYNNAGVSSNKYSGGICGYSKNESISECYNTGYILSTLNYWIDGDVDVFSGGICGYSEYSEIGVLSNCYNNGNITSSVTVSRQSYSEASCTSFSGGICGSSGSVVSNCYNTGIITSSAKNENSRSFNNGTVTANASAYCGGLCGSSNQNITNSYNTGALSSSATSKADNTNRDASYHSSKPTTAASSNSLTYTGGICGKQTDGTISNCYNTADLSSSVEAQAYYYGTESFKYGTETRYKYNSSQSNGNIRSYKYIGGIAGESSAEINSCYNVGAATYGIRGGGSGAISNCYYLSTAGYSNTGAKALTSAQLKLEMCMPKFDFENTWVIYHTTEYNYPQLRCNLQDEPLMIGDANGDGIIDINDATCIQKHLAEYETDDYIEETSDTNQDGRINIRDVTEIQRYLIESPSEHIGKPIE